MPLCDPTHQLTSLTCVFVTDQVGKTRYGEQVNHVSDDIREERDQLLIENSLLKSKIALLEKGCTKSSDNLYDSIQSAFDVLQQNIVKV